MTNSATICPKDYCRALIPATGEDRAAHLAGHASDEKAARAMRDEQLQIRELIADLKEDNRNFRNEIKGIHNQGPADALVIEEWPEDELPDDSTVTDEDDSEINVDQETGDATYFPAIDRDDDLDARLANATGQQPTI